MNKGLTVAGGLMLGFALVLSALPAFATTPTYIGPPEKGGGIINTDQDPQVQPPISKTFLQRTAIVDAVDVTNNTITVHYLYACPAIARADGTPVCTAVVQSEVISPDSTLFLTSYNLVLASVQGIKQGKQVTIYTKVVDSNSTKAYLVRVTPCMLSSETVTVPAPGGTTTVQMPCAVESVGSGGGVMPAVPQPLPGSTNGSNGSITNPAPRTSSVESSSIFVRDLEVGSRDETVRMLQDKLRQLGVFPLGTPSTGYFGPTTRSAVVEYQRQHGIPTTGFVGPLTRSSLEQDQ